MPWSTGSMERYPVPLSRPPLKIREHAQVPVGSRIDTVDKVRAWKMQTLLRDLRRLKSQQRIRLRPKISLNFPQAYSRGHDKLLVYSRIPFDSMPPAAVSTSQSSFPFFG